MVRSLGKERGLGEPVWADSPRIGLLSGSDRSWIVRTAPTIWRALGARLGISI